MSQKRHIVIVTGMAGAGLHTTLTAMQDVGFTVTDNPPLLAVEAIIKATDPKPLALGIDSRTDGFSSAEVTKLLDKLDKAGAEVRLLFLECEDHVLLTRFSETRRVHPLAPDKPVEVGLMLERSKVAPLKSQAFLTVDTTEASTTELRHLIHNNFPQEGRGLVIQVMSFGYPKGLPRNADFIFDARGLANPHYIEALRPKTGQDLEVGNYIAQDSAYPQFFNCATGLVGASLPGFQRNDRAYLTIAFGCTGGKHRSVFLAESMAAWLEQQGYPVLVNHREMEKAGLARPRLRQQQFG
jgi:UPF0042 nucleotide-binding protein